MRDTYADNLAKKKFGKKWHELSLEEKIEVVDKISLSE